MIKLNNQLYSSLQEAINHAKEYDTLFIQNGIYEEVITINTPHLTLQGEDRDKAIITFNHGGYDLLSENEKRGTFRSYTCFVNANHVKLENLTIQNTAGLGKDRGQAIALYADGNIIVSHCNLKSRQDTLFVAPLPEKEIEPRGFRGPKEFEPRTMTNQVYDSCTIEGDIDFIFGGGNAIFKNCTIHSLTLHQECNGYICAPSTYPNESGFLFDHCTFTSDCEKETVYLGRPWRENARCVIQDSYLGEHIKKEGWHSWNKDISHTHFEEIRNSGPGSSLDSRISWIRKDSSNDN